MANIVGFSRLKGLFSGSLNLTTYKSILSAAGNAECGTLSKDLIGILLSKGATSGKKAEIEAIKDAFVSASDTLAHGISVTQRAQMIELQRLYSSFDKHKIISLNFLRDIKLPAAQPKACTRGIDSASQALTEKFSSIIPNCAKVEIKPLGMGAYGQGYKLEFLDANGNKLIHDKVLKVFYKDGQSVMDLLTKISPTLIEKTKEFSSQFSLRDIITMWNNIKNLSTEEVITFLKPFEEQLTKQGISLKPEDVEKALSKLKTVKLKDIKPIFSEISKLSSNGSDVEKGKELLNKFQEHMSQVHGVCAEANTMMFLRSRLGHTLSKTNVVAPDYYNLKKGFSIAEFSDDLLPASTSEVNFGLLGLQHQDLHDANKVAGRIIDIGGIQLTTPELSDKITARYYKKIMNQKNLELRSKYIEQLRKEMELMNDLDKEKVQKAIDLADKKSTGFSGIEQLLHSLQSAKPNFAVA